MTNQSSDKQTRDNSLLPAILVSVVVLFATVVLWQALQSKEHANLRQGVFLQASNVRAQVQARMQERVQERILALQRMANRWESAGGTPRSVWERDALAYYQDFGGYQAIEWVDSNFRVQWTVPLNAAAQALDPTGDDGHKQTVTRLINLAGGAKASLPPYP